MKKTFLYLHGFASSSQGAKAQFFREKFKVMPHITYRAIDFNPTVQDFEYMTITGLINRLRQYLLDHSFENLSLIGSSLGGLVTLHYAHCFGKVEKLLLLAPALAYRADRRSEAELQQWQRDGKINVPHYALGQNTPLRYNHHVDGLQYLEPVSPSTPSLIIHGIHDDVVPITGSRDYTAQYPDQVQLVEVDSDHRLNDQLDLIWEHAQLFLL